MKYVIAIILLVIAAVVGSVKFDVPSPLLGIYVTRHPVDMRNTDYYFNPMTRQVYYAHMGNWSENGLQPVEGARKSAFTVFSMEYGGSSTMIYFKATPLPFLDAATANVLASFDTFTPYLKDKSAVYLMTDEAVPTYAKLEQADPDTFDIEAPEDGSGKTFFAKDKNHCYYMGRILTGVQPEKFSALKASQFGDGEFAYSLEFDTNVERTAGPIDVKTLFKSPLPPEASDGDDKDAGGDEEQQDADPRAQ